MSPRDFMMKYTYIIRIEYELHYLRCFFIDVNETEIVSSEFNGSAYTDGKAVDTWAKTHCTEDTTWNRDKSEEKPL